MQRLQNTYEPAAMPRMTDRDRQRDRMDWSGEISREPTEHR